MRTRTRTQGAVAHRVHLAFGVALVLAAVITTIVAPRSALNYVLLLTANAFGFVQCALSLRHANRRLLRCWSLFALASLSAGGMTAEMLLHSLGIGPSVVSSVPIAVLAFQLFAILGCLTLIALPVSPAARAQALLDQVNTGVVAGIIAWVVCYSRLDGLYAPGTAAFVLNYLRVVGDCLIVTMLVSICLILRPRGRLATPVLMKLTFGLGVLVVVDLVCARTQASIETMQIALAVGGACASVAFGLASSSPRTFVRRTPKVARGLAYGQLVPSVASASVLVGVFAESRIAGESSGILEWLASSLVACVLVRQVISWTEEQRLVRLLEARIADRTEALGMREQQFRALVQKSSDVILIAQEDGSCSYVSPSLQHVFGHSPEVVTSGTILDIVKENDRSRVTALLELARRRSGESFSAEWHIRHADGTDRLVEVLLRNLLDEPAVAGLVINLRDITDRKVLEDRLTHQAMHDHLTGLGNRAQLRVRTEQALSGWLFQNQPFSLLVVDINDFKSINDTLGHVIGDQALKTISERIAENTRRGDTVVRVDGDEFAVLIEGVAATDEEAHYIAERICDAVQRPMRVEGRRIALRASAGLACVSDRVSHADDIIRNADLALNAAKVNRSNEVVLFEEGMRDSAMRRAELENDLRRALERDELQLYYQPTVDLATGMFDGVEALLRWPHPDKGFIPPLDFIPIAEESGLIVPIGKWVLEQACLQMAKWQARTHCETPLKMNVNLSVRQFDQPDIVDVVHNVMDLTGIAPGSLVLEVTESVLMENSSAVNRKMEQLVGLGCRLAIDDFGTGYSSLSYLQRYPISVLKIDRSFVNEIGNSDNRESALVKAIVDIADTLGLKTVAEGIETRQQLEELRDLGCDSGQGFLMAKPMPPMDVQRLLESTHSRGLPIPEAAPMQQQD